MKTYRKNKTTNKTDLQEFFENPGYQTTSMTTWFRSSVLKMCVIIMCCSAGVPCVFVKMQKKQNQSKPTMASKNI